jgi:hypothetical protein
MKTRIKLSDVLAALDRNEVSATAQIINSVPRFFGDVYQVKLKIDCGGFSFEIVDEVGQNVRDFDLNHPYPICHESLELDRADSDMPKDFGLELGGSALPRRLSEKEVRSIASAIVTRHKTTIRDTIAKLLPERP